ncbi:hypothetical protein ACFVDI_14220 [Nocardioides sp. NPDC057767]|uniref:hypothetical protein n=1 Tax=unclassified Nocardioides TaxID=2615069 RepID=UPI0036726796
MDTAWISAASGFVGALVGAGAALGGKWLDAYFARKAERRRRAAELLEQFWEVTERMWRLGMEADELDHWIDGNPVGETRFPDEPPVSEQDHAVWRREASERRLGWTEANREAGILLGRMRLLNLPITEEAKALRAASVRSYGREKNPLVKRKEALETFEKAAQRFMGS